MSVRMLAVALVGLCALTGCVEGGGVEGRGVEGRGVESRPAGGVSVRSSPYALFTHCGVDEANIDGRWYQAAEPLSDGSGNPPGGWGNPYQEGVVAFTSDTTAVFSDSAGHRVLFVLRPGAAGPRQVCS